MIPDYIQKMKPKGYDACTISESHGIFYVYQRTHEWDDKRQKMVSKRRSIGRIDPTVGFIPNSYGQQLAASGASVAGGSKSGEGKTAAFGESANPNAAPKKPKKKSNPAATLEFADGYELFLQTSPQIEKNLREVFGDDADMILAVALMRLVQSTVAYELEESYPTSYASALWPGLDLSRESVERFLVDTGKRTEDISRFLATLVTPGRKILLDGTDFFLEAEERAANGDPAVHSAYVLNAEDQVPQYYIYTDARPKAKDLIRAAREAGVDDGVAVMDKKTWSINGPSLFETAGLDYVMEVPKEQNRAGVEWIRTHGADGFEEAFDDHAKMFGEIIPNPDAFGSLYLYIYGDDYERLLDSSLEELENLPDLKLSPDGYATNLKDSLTELPHEMSWLPNHTFFYFLAVQRALKVPWHYDRDEERRIIYDHEKDDPKKPGVAFLDFLGLYYWQACDYASAKAGIKMPMCDLLVTARSDESIDLNHGMQVHSTIRARNAAFKRLGITRAKDLPPKELPPEEDTN